MLVQISITYKIEFHLHHASSHGTRSGTHTHTHSSQTIFDIYCVRILCCSFSSLVCMPLVCTVKLNLQDTNSKRRAYVYESSNMWCYVPFWISRSTLFIFFGCFASLSLFQFDTITLKQKPNETHQTDRHETCGFHIPHRIHVFDIFFSFARSHIIYFFRCSRSYSLLCLLFFLVQSSLASSGWTAVVSLYICLRAASTLTVRKTYWKESLRVAIHFDQRLPSA